MSLVSVIVPTYNRAHLMQRCYESVVAQTHRPLEFVVTDDASQDNTAEVVYALPSHQDVQVRYVQQPHNQGVSAARNAAIRASSGKFIAFLDSDDIWLPHHVTTLLAILESGRADVVYARAEVRASPDDPQTDRDFGPTEYEEQNFKRCLYFNNCVLPSVTIMSRAALDEMGLFDEDPAIQRAEDWDFILRAVRAGLRFHHQRQITGIYMVPDEMPPEKNLILFRDSIYCLEKHRDYSHTPEALKRLGLGYYLIRYGTLLLRDQPRQAAVCFNKLRAMAKTDLLLWFGGLAGAMCVSRFGRRSSLAQRFLLWSFRRIRARHRLQRGIPVHVD